MICLEIDGEYHETVDQQAIDEERTIRLHELGVRVMRFTNAEIFNDFSAVLNRIIEKSKERYRPTKLVN